MFYRISVPSLAPDQVKEVTKLSLVAITPWTIFLSWQAPEGPSLDDILHYEFTGGIVQNVISKTKDNFLALTRQIQPNSPYGVNIRVVYKSGQVSKQVSANVTTPKARKYMKFHFSIGNIKIY